MQPLRQSILDMEAIMSVADIYEKRATFSFEVFPPKTDVGMEKLCGKDGVLDKLYTLQPDYISCTYGAGGTNVGKNLEVLDKIQKDGKTIPVTHFTCIGNTKEDIKEKLQTYLDHGIDHMLALRGDLPFGWTGTNGDLHYATELVKFVRKEFGDKFTIAVAGSPEGHIQCRSLEADIAFLKQKQDNGADFIISQLCWDMDEFPTDLYETSTVMWEVLAEGQIGPHGGLNFDAKARRGSFELEDIFHSYIAGMDTFALGLRIADKLITDGRIDKFVEDRYASWNTGIGADIISGKATMADLEKYALEKGEVTASLTSGRQEMLEAIMNEIMFSL